ncbi:MAG: nucleoside monophosphate kinase [Candidatus Kerfeldbacteria bacterium]|nr:nucleoside monophosphate kinase [Candidatus Kerfeldbacteria bacterium]
MAKRQQSPHRIVILGPQGSGKGTQAARLAKLLKLPHISTGDIFRTHIKHRTPLGRKVSALLDAGSLVSNRLTNQILAHRLRRPDCRRGYVLDGYPRTLSQARFLERVARPTVVANFELADREAVKRLRGRRMAPDGTIYHLRFNPPPKRLRGRLMVREDDRPAAVRRRLKTYRRAVAPLLKFYRRAGLLVSVDARPIIPRVGRAILNIVRRRAGRLGR